jgi:hypothetical protein
MGRSTLAIVAKRSLAASVRGTLNRLPSAIPCNASLSRLQEIMALAPVSLPKSARQAAAAAGGGKSGDDPSGNGNGEEKDQKLGSSEIDAAAAASSVPSSPVVAPGEETQSPVSAVGREAAAAVGLVNRSSPVSPVNEIDHALILGLDGSASREGVSGILPLLLVTLLTPPLVFVAVE